jgi:hypothetical protein
MVLFRAVARTVVIVIGVLVLVLLSFIGMVFPRKSGQG